ncbi:MAG: LytTR family transcriptional regulator, partial [Actinomycetota bacterium]|nr:LytTR family transcriptional regulator [Actinomycetota bacterium]
MAGRHASDEEAEEPTTYAKAVGKVPVPSGEDTDADEETAPRRRTSGLLITGRVVLGLVSAATLAALSLVWLRVDQLDESKNTTDAISVAQEGEAVTSDDDGATDILVVGNDSRTDMQGRPLSEELLRELRTEATETLNTDTLILLRIPHDGSRGSAISIPRDTS